MDNLRLVSLQLLATWLNLGEIAHGLVRALLMGVGCFAIIAFFELRSGKSLAFYASRNFLTDLLYRVFFIVYMAILYNPLVAVLRDAAPSLNQAELTRMPLPIAFVLYWLVFDGLSYWIHRAQHSRIWWRFHRVHHSQEKMTFASGYRNHPIDQMFAHSITLVPSLLLGAPVIVWLPYSFLLTFLDAIHHAGLPWRFGPLRKIFVSPVFHAAHHSTNPAIHNRNYGGLLSMWDFLFGTAYDAEELPERTGVEGWQVRESFWSQVMSPFRKGSVVEQPAPRAGR